MISRDRGESIKIEGIVVRLGWEVSSRNRRKVSVFEWGGMGGDMVRKLGRVYIIESFVGYKLSYVGFILSCR